MAGFDYVAIDTKGAEKRGFIPAETVDAARAALEKQRLYVVSVKPGSGDTAERRPLFGLKLGRARMSVKQLTLFTRQLATLNRVSPLEESLRTITRQTEQERVRAIVATVHQGVTEGRRLADAMAREPKSFPPLYRAMVAAGRVRGRCRPSSNASPRCWSDKQRFAASSSPRSPIRRSWRSWRWASSPR